MWVIYLLILFIPIQASEPFVIGQLMGQLGNQMFIVSATYSLALDHGAQALFPDFVFDDDPTYQFAKNYERVFFRCSTQFPEEPIDFVHYETNFHYTPIPYTPNMVLFGWFQSEKYFQHHRQEILDLFAPSQEIVDYLQNKYSHVIEHPQSVAIHYRSYKEEDPDQQCYISQPKEYYQKAVKRFPKNALFVVFSNDIHWCKEHFKGLAKNMIYIEGEESYHDIYLISFCKHQIIGNSSFSWWGAYLNKNPNKRIIAPLRWFNPAYKSDTDDLIPKNWERV